MVSKCLHMSSISDSEDFAPRRAAALARPLSSAWERETTRHHRRPRPDSCCKAGPTRRGGRSSPARQEAGFEGALGVRRPGPATRRGTPAPARRLPRRWRYAAAAVLHSPPRAARPALRPPPGAGSRPRVPAPGANRFTDWLPPPWAPPTPARGPVHRAAVLVGLVPVHPRFGPREGAPPRGLVGWQGACASLWPRPSSPRSRSCRRFWPCSGLARPRPPSRHGGRRGGAVPFPRSPAKEGDRRRLLPRPLPRLRRARGAASCAGHRRGPGGAGHAGEGRWGGAAPGSGPESRRRAALGGLQEPAWSGAPELCPTALWDCGEWRPRFRGAADECGAGAFIQERPWPPGGPRRRREQGTPLKDCVGTRLLTVPAKHAF